MLTIVGLAAALVVPNLPGAFSATRVGNAAQATLAFLREARARAIVRGVVVDLTVDPKSGAYRFADRSAAVGSDIALALTTRLPAGRDAEGLGIIRFYPDGASSGATFDFSAGNLPGNIHSIVRVDPLTGRISIGR